MSLKIPSVLPVAVFLHEILAEFEKVIVHNSLADVFHQIDEEVKVVVTG